MQPSFAVHKRPRNISAASSKIGLKDERPKGTAPILRMANICYQASVFKCVSIIISFQESALKNNTNKYHEAGGFVSLYIIRSRILSQVVYFGTYNYKTWATSIIATMHGAVHS